MRKVLLILGLVAIASVNSVQARTIGTNPRGAQADLWCNGAHSYSNLALSPYSELCQDWLGNWGPTTNSTGSLGTSSFHWARAYIDDISARGITASSVTVSALLVIPSITSSALNAGTISGSIPNNALFNVTDSSGANSFGVCITTGPGGATLVGLSGVYCGGATFLAAVLPTQTLLGSTTGFADFSASAGAFTCTRSTVSSGNVGTSGAITYTSCVVAQSSAVTPSAQNLTDFASATTTIAALPCDQTLTGTLAGITLTPGVYCFTAGATLTGNLVLNGPATAIWTIKTGTGGAGALSATNFNVSMSGGGLARNVYWQSKDSTALTTSSFIGNILSGNAITITGTDVVGRALATGAITLTDTTEAIPQ